MRRWYSEFGHEVVLFLPFVVSIALSFVSSIKPNYHDRRDNNVKCISFSGYLLLPGVWLCNIFMDKVL